MTLKQLDSVIFDLDGTLWDTCPSCAIAWNNVVRRHGIPFREIVAEDVRRVTGKPHEVCIRETFAGLTEHQLQLLITDTMEEDNIVVDKLGGVIYDGVESGLNALAQRFPLFIVSSCQSGYIETFLRLSGFGHLFRDFECWGNTRKSKSENIALIMTRNNLVNSVYVGDTEGDRVAARNCKIPFHFVEYGFGRVTDRDATFSSFGQFTDHLISSLSR